MLSMLFYIKNGSLQKVKNRIKSPEQKPQKSQKISVVTKSQKSPPEVPRGRGHRQLKPQVKVAPVSCPLPDSH